MSEPMVANVIDEPCCEVWSKICGAFAWMKYSDCPRVMAMPHIKSAGSSWRINHCPSCGAEVRGKEFTDHFINHSRSLLD